MPETWAATPKTTGVGDGSEDFQPDHAKRGSRGPRRARTTIRYTVIASTVVVVYLLVLATGLAIGRSVTLPKAPLNTGGGAINTVARSLLGYGDRSDFLVDYASAHALAHGRNAYGISAQLIKAVGPAWNVQTADPHPPTLLTLVLPTTLLSYHVALAAWELAMIFVLIWTLYLVGVPLFYAIPIGLAVAITIPGNYGIANPVPVIGLGVAIAYRWRDNPAVAGLGVALAAVPKESGALLAIAFLVAGRLWTVAWTALWYGLAAIVPLSFDTHIWTHYFNAGIRAIDANANWSANASLLLLGRSSGVPDVATLLVIGVLACAVAIARRDLFWPLVWAMVAALPVAWSYSQLTFLPLIAWAVVRGSRRSAALAVLTVGLVLGTAPNDAWTKAVFPLVTVVVLVLLVTARADPDGALWLPPHYDPFLSWPILGRQRNRGAVKR